MLHTTGNASARAHVDSWMCNNTLIGSKNIFVHYVYYDTKYHLFLD